MRLRGPLQLALAFGIFIVLTNCGDTLPLAGKYKSQGDKSQERPDIMMTLEANGQGSWASEGDSAPFRWDLKGDEILLHTKSGGILQGKASGETLEISLPGMGGPLVFKKIKN